MKKVFSLKFFFTIALFFFIIFIYSQVGFNHWPVVATIDRPHLASGWGEPRSLGLNTNNWESGVSISGDGHTLFYSYYPGDLVYDSSIGSLSDDIDVYYSETPFNKYKIHALSEENWSEAGAMMSGSDIYYTSNRLGAGDIYKNGHILIDTPDKLENNPHYCTTKEELFFDSAGDIYLSKGQNIMALPFPINDGSQNSQPFLNKNCDEIYFSSTRGDGISKILKATLRADNLWSQPELVVSSKYGVGEPSLTDDGRLLFFVQILKSAKGVLNADILYTELLQ